eukprot:CAMPEP_0174822044 /NCGR_PEP_ID=MMETSP1107-20130205/12726_1 /TAXON_ID=36770 /ORGANISM="Paraphysomonas vestita, Strain GFlagA" /LENGTH=618 /DNA_ID=CAMNT_0016039945 /DNA_START=219 /DNA_END=2075 /DNA_ORIENTATION=+
MNCPTNLQPHQIQGGVGGSDYPAIYPVMVWLVKKFFQRREEREAQLRSFSTLQFSKNFRFPQESDSRTVSTDLAKILERNKASRLFKRKQIIGGSEETLVRSCLLEYGETFANATATTGNEDGSNNSSNDSSKRSGGKGSSNNVNNSSVSTSSTSSSTSTSGGNDESKVGGNVLVQNALLETGKRVIRIVETNNDISLAGLTKLSGAVGGKEQLSGFEKKLALAHAEAQREDAQFAAEASKMQAELMQHMSQIEGDESTGAISISGSSVGQIVGLGSSEIGSAVAAYKAEVEEAKRIMDESLAGGKVGQSAALKRQHNNLLKQKEAADLKAANLRVSTEGLLERMRILEQERDSAQDYNRRLNEQLKKLADLEKNATQQDELNSLKNLVALNETLRSQEAEFKESCKAQLMELKALIAAAEGAEMDEKDLEEEKKLRDIEDMHGKVMAKYNRLRALLAQTNLDLARNVRIIDDVPTRSELIQYERRFVELYQQVAWKLDETKKYYSLYNTLDTTLTFIQKEVKLLNSIGDSFDEAMKSSQSTQEYLEQFRNIVKGVEDSLKRQVNVAAQRDQRVEELKQTHQNLVDEQRKYFKAVKDFQEECTKNEWLEEKLEQLTRQ